MRDFLLQFFVNNPSYHEWVICGLAASTTGIVGIAATKKRLSWIFVVLSVCFAAIAIPVAGTLPGFYLEQFKSPCFNKKAHEYLTRGKGDRTIGLSKAIEMQEACAAEQEKDSKAMEQLEALGDGNNGY